MRILPQAGGRVLTADLVDVSAGGLRVRSRLPVRHATGVAVDVEIRLAREPGLPAPTEVSLRGSGRILRVEADPAGDRLETALRFTGSLEMREPFDRLLVF